MDTRSTAILVLTGAAVVGSMMAAGLFGFFVIALMAAAVTVGLKTGSLAPYYPMVSRAEAPRKFWLVMGACAALVLLNIINLVVRG